LRMANCGCWHCPLCCCCTSLCFWWGIGRVPSIVCVTVERCANVNEQNHPLVVTHYCMKVSDVRKATLVKVNTQTLSLVISIVFVTGCSSSSQRIDSLVSTRI
jgi:hypothetical protein